MKEYIRSSFWFKKKNRLQEVTRDVLPVWWWQLWWGAPSRKMPQQPSLSCPSSHQQTCNINKVIGNQCTTPASPDIPLTIIASAMLGSTLIWIRSQNFNHCTIKTKKVSSGSFLVFRHSVLAVSYRGPRNQHASGPWSESIDIIGKLLSWAKTFGLKSSAVVIFMTWQTPILKSPEVRMQLPEWLHGNTALGYTTTPTTTTTNNNNKKRISRGPIHRTRWESRALYNNTRTHARTHARTRARALAPDGGRDRHGCEKD